MKNIKTRMLRLAIMLGASAGLVALVADAAYARVAGNHCEPAR
jgi:hypothetical protein